MTDANIRSNVKDEVLNKEKSLLQYFKKRLTKQESQQENFYYTLQKFGIRDEQVKKCVAEIQAGKILIIVVDEMKIGHAPLNEVVRPVLTIDKKEDSG